MKLTTQEHRKLIAARDALLETLSTEADKRASRDNWELMEREAMTAHTNRIAEAHGKPWRFTTDEVEQMAENRAVGHSDYATSSPCTAPSWHWWASRGDQRPLLRSLLDRPRSRLGRGRCPGVDS